MDTLLQTLVDRLRLQGEVQAAEIVTHLAHRAESAERRLAIFHSLLLDFVARVTVEAQDDGPDHLPPGGA